MNLAILNMLMTLKEDQKWPWKWDTNNLVYAYDCTQKSTALFNFLPNFWQKARTLIHLFLPNPANQEHKIENFAEKFR